MEIAKNTMGIKLTLGKAKQMMEESGGSLDLRGTQITGLPDNLTVGGSLYLSGTQITGLPDNLTVGGSLDLRGTQISRKERLKVNKLNDGECNPGKYLYADGILTHIKSTKKAGEYTLYIGKIKGKNLVSDGKNYAHCNDFRDGIADLKFKEAKDRGADQFRGMDMDKKIPLEDCKTMYRIITGACRQGTEAFAESLHSAGKLQDSYTVREMIEVTKGQYNAESFARFWEE